MTLPEQRNSVRWVNEATGDTIIELTQRDFTRIRQLVRDSQEHRPDQRLLYKVDLVVAWFEGRGRARLRDSRSS